MVRLNKLCPATRRGLIGITDNGNVRLKEIPLETGAVECFPGIMKELGRIADNDWAYYLLEHVPNSRFVAYAIFERR